MHLRYLRWVARSSSSAKRTGSSANIKQSQGKNGQKAAPLTEENLKQLRKTVQTAKVPATTTATSKHRPVAEVTDEAEQETKKTTETIDGGFALVSRSRRAGRKS